MTLRATGGSGSDPATPLFAQVLGTLPAAAAQRTYLKIDERLVDRGFSAIELIAPGVAGAWMTLETATMTRRADPANRTIDFVVAAASD